MDTPDSLAHADRAFLAINASLTQESDPARVLAVALGGAVELAQADRGRAYLLDAEMKRLHCCALSPDTRPEPEAIDIDDDALGQSPLVYCLRRGEVVAIADVYRYSGFSCDVVYGWDNAQAERARSRTWRLLTIPLRDHADRAVGTLVLQRCGSDTAPPPPFTGETAGQILRFTKHAASAVTAARLAAENRDLQMLVKKLHHRTAEPATPTPPGKMERAFAPLIGNSPSLRAARHLAERAAPTVVTVMIQGETGTGKDVMARAIHDASPRSDKPFVVQNCAAIPQSMLEAELFGWEKGAFSGAHAANPGLIAHAHGGTLFLDEIGDMPLELQPKLLRVLQDGKIRSLGASVERKVDIRIITATHRDLEARIAEGTFRADLYYRLAVFPILLAPLRDRPEDLVPLVRHFLGKCHDTLGSSMTEIDPSVISRLERHWWPGNVRELRNVVERAVLMAGPNSRAWTELPELGVLSEPEEETPDSSLWPELAAMPLKDAVEHVEARLIRRHLAEAGGNLMHAATRLGMPRRTLAHKIQRYGIGEE